MISIVEILSLDHSTSQIVMNIYDKRQGLEEFTTRRKSMSCYTWLGLLVG